MRLSELVFPTSRTARSINLERDYNDIDVLNHYQISLKAEEILERFIAAVEGERVFAWSLVGPYGMGKSAFLNYLLAVTGPADSVKTKDALQKLKLANYNLYKRFIKAKEKTVGKEGFFGVPIVSSFEPINNTLARGLQSRIKQSDFKNKTQICSQLEKSLGEDQVNSAELLSICKRIIRLTHKPLAIVIDEFGKNLEYLTYHYHNGDLFILQQLAEMEGTFLWVCLHQAFDEYISDSSTVQQQEWNKVRGRFEEISFVETTPQVLNLISTILKHDLDEERQRRVKKWAVCVKDTLENTFVMDREHLDLGTITDIYPFHPLTALSLIQLCRRFAQNERTLVSFLSSGQIYALPAQIKKISFPLDNKTVPAVGLDALYDYFFQLTYTNLINTPEAQRWIEIHDILETRGNLPGDELLLLKNIGILNLLAGSQGLKASFEIICSLMVYTYGWETEKIKLKLDKLVRRGVIFFRDYSNEYRLWEGSVFDVSGALRKERSKLTVGSIKAILEEHLTLSPVVAARYVYEKGIIRRFERRWLDAESLSEKLLPHKGYDGLMLYCFGTAKELPWAPSTCSDKRPIILAYAPVKRMLEEIVLEIAACQGVLDNYHVLVHDKVARKEVAFRLRVARDRFRDYLARTFVPGAAGLLWYINGRRCQISNGRELSETISKLCYESYYSAPTIKNEIISCENLSSAAARARRELVEAMATNAGEEDLGFTGWGPEVAIYRSLLRAKGLHRKNEETGVWYLTLKSNDPALNELWEELDRLVEKEYTQGITVAALLNKLRDVPFGMRQGPAMLYISHYLLVKSEALAVFREGAYNPYLSAADMALLLKRPELFSIKKFKATRIQEKVFSTYRAILGQVELKGDLRLRNETMLGAVGPLVKFIDQLPRYSKQTRELTEQTRLVRSVILNADDPLNLLFKELPEAVDININGEEANLKDSLEQLQERLKFSLMELALAYGRLNQKLQQELIRSFRKSDLNQLYNTQRKRVQGLIRVCGDPELKPVLQAMGRDESNLEEWVRGIAGIIVKKPVDSWKDQDITVFAAKLTDFADRIEQLEALVSANGYAPAENANLISVLKPDGSIKRGLVRFDGEDEEVDRLLAQILDLPKEKSKKVLALLAEKII